MSEQAQKRYRPDPTPEQQAMLDRFKEIRDDMSQSLAASTLVTGDETAHMGGATISPTVAEEAYGGSAGKETFLAKSLDWPGDLPVNPPAVYKAIRTLHRQNLTHDRDLAWAASKLNSRRLCLGVKVWLRSSWQLFWRRF